MSLYRTYRPKTFDDVTGQDHVISTLAQAVVHDKMAHAYLFAGTRGTGKTSTARILAKILLTRGITDEKLRDQIIDAADEGTLTDLTEIDAASNTGVDNIRELIEKIQFTPVIAGAKVYIIDEVHMLSKGAFNALLKTLEEPPPYAYFILATTELHKIPATIQSRCQRFLFKQIAEKDIVARLSHIANLEKIDADEEALTAIARHARGGMRDAVGLLDQLRSLEKITAADVRERIGETGHEYVNDVFATISGGDITAIPATVRKLEETGVPLENFIRLLLEIVRENMHADVEAKRSPEASRRMLDALLQAVKDVRTAPLPALVLESALLSLCTRGGDSAAPAVAAPAVKAPPAVKPKTDDKPISPATTDDKPTTDAVPANDAPPASQASMPTSETVRERWEEVLALVQPPSARMSLKNGRVHEVDGSTVIVRFTSAFHRDKASAPEGAHSLHAAMATVFGAPLNIRFVLESDVFGPGPGAREANVDLAEAALEVF